jgi:histidinol-phosphate aminotransferase
MALSRRAFMRRVGVGGAGALGVALSSRRSEAARVQNLPEPNLPLVEPGTIRISTNENPRGPGDAALEALRARVSGRLGRYPDNVADLTAAIARRYGARPENVLLSTGSNSELIAGVRAFASPARGVVNGVPSYATPNRTAELNRIPVRLVPVDRDLRLDLDRMEAAATGAGLLFICNPNNPTSTIHSRAAIEALVAKVRSGSPRTAILIDEAYMDYATDPSAGTAAPLALEHPGVFVVRTFSKGYGMAGLRLGYALGRPETLKALSDAWGLGSVNVLSAAAAIASLGDPAHMERERQENRRTREFTLNGFRQMGFSAPESQTNFVFVNIGRPAAGFREVCAKFGIRVGNGYAPFEATHCRISIGTMEEMRQAMEVFRKVLGVRPTAH